MLFREKILQYVILVLHLAVYAVRDITGQQEKPPNIIWMLADDLGFNDLGFRNPDVITPYIDKLAREGVILTNHYMQPLCSASRSALLTGRYPCHTGMQHAVILSNNHWCTPLKYKMLPQYLKDLDYSTHAIGKWHLGHCRKECTPLYRGFDTFSGGYCGGGDYYEHTCEGRYDWFDGYNINKSAQGVHSEDLVLHRALDVLEKQDGSSPFFLYLSFFNPHYPLQPKQEMLNMYQDLDASEKRKKYLGLVSGMDAVIGQIMEKLETTGLDQNTVVIFASDNGGEPEESDNTPFRGGKGSLWEGGTKSGSFIWSPLLEKTGYNNDGLLHVTDWLPTLVNLASGNLNRGDLDGLDQSDMILRGGSSVRTHMIYNLDREYEHMSSSQYGEMAVRIGNYKLIWGMPGNTDGYGSLMNFTPRLRFYKEFTSRIEGSESLIKNIPYPPHKFTTEENTIMDVFRQSVQVTDENLFSGQGFMLLFNLKDDPHETTNLVLSKDPEHQRALRDLVQMVQVEIQKHYQDVGPEWGVTSTKAAAADVVTTGWCTETVPLPADGMEGLYSTKKKMDVKEYCSTKDKNDRTECKNLYP